MMRFKDVDTICCRATSKTFLTILAMFLQCVFIPGHNNFIAAPHKNQSAAIAKQKILEIYQLWPLLIKEVEGNEYSETPGNFGKDYVELRFRNGSTFQVVGAADSTRGQRKHSGLVDETLDHDENIISEVVIPLLNVSRYLPDGTINDREPNRQLIFMSSASVKGDYNYDKLIDIFENSIIDPKNAFAMGMDYRIPQMHGLISKEYINKLKMSPSFSEEAFAREYASIFTGGASDSWYSYDKIQRYRKIKNPELRAKFIKDQNIFYFISVDVSHFGEDKTIATVFRVNVTDTHYLITVVNIIPLGKRPETRTFNKQAIEIKKLIKAYEARGCSIDLNGVGGGLGEFMIQEQIDDDGVIYPAYGFINDKDYLKVQPVGAIKILYGMKANATLKSQINANAYSMLSSGKIRFLIKEQEAKASLLSSAKGQKMSAVARIERLMPHEMTTRLFEEMANLRVKQTGLDIILESINSRIHDDIYYSYVYGLWFIHEMEEEYYKKLRRRTGQSRQLTFYSGG